MVAMNDHNELPHLRYARLLDWGTRIGLALLLLGFLAYVTGFLPAQVPVQQLPELWTQPLPRYLELSGVSTGWAWAANLHRGDMLCLAGIAVLAGCSGLCVRRCCRCTAPAQIRPTRRTGGWPWPRWRCCCWRPQAFSKGGIDSWR